MKQLTDYILVIKDAISDDLCKLILEEYKESNSWEKAKTLAELNGYTSDHRSCYLINLSSDHKQGYREVIRKNIDNRLFSETVSECLREYLELFPRCEVKEDTGYDLLKYEKGQFFKNHVDYYSGEKRVISLSLALNDDYEGGEFAFFNGEVTYVLNKGDALMFPSNFMYDHEIKTVTQGTRYSVITWFT